MNKWMQKVLGEMVVDLDRFDTFGLEEMGVDTFVVDAMGALGALDAGLRLQLKLMRLYMGLEMRGGLTGRGKREVLIGVWH